MSCNSPITNENYIITGITNNYGFCIKKSAFHDFVIETVKNHFTMQPLIKYPKVGVDYSIIAWYEDAKYLVLPKFTDGYIISGLSIHHINTPKAEKPTTLLDLIEQKVENNNANEITIKTITFISTKISYKPPITTNVVFNGELREHQKQSMQHVLSVFESAKIKGGLLHMDCGIGKTVFAIYLATVLKLKAIIVTYQCFLIDQWTAEIERFTNGTTGFIKGNSYKIDDCDFVVASLKSLSMKGYEEIDFTQFGIAIYDECHHAGSKVYSQSHFKTRAKYTIGLSATPFRQDNMHTLIELNLGPILLRAEKKVNYKIMVKRIMFRSANEKFCPIASRIKGSKKPVPNNAKMIANLSNIGSRNKLIMDILTRLVTIGRKIFVFSSRTKHVENMKARFDAILEGLEVENITTGIMHGKIDRKLRDEAINTCDVIFATQHIAEEALNAPRFNTIILALPYNNKQTTLIQTAGRILRNATLESYLAVPLVIDFADMLSIYQDWACNREKVYLKKKWFLQDFHWTDCEFARLDEKQNGIAPINIMTNDLLDEEFVNANLILDENHVEEDCENCESEEEGMNKGKMYDDLFNEEE
jgi:superfamily II DNA or RNA helicase